MQVVMHDLASADSRDIPRSACFESKAPTCLAFLLLNLPGLAGYSRGGGDGGGGTQPGSSGRVRGRCCADQGGTEIPGRCMC